MEYDEDDYLMLSGIQHFEFCRRQWALIHIEQQWEENLRTVEGEIMHKNAHDDQFVEKRRNVIITRGLPVFSRAMGVNGNCDIVEFVRDDDHGIEISGRVGKYLVEPVEYKRGEPKETAEDILQLTAQSLCLEEMLMCRIDQGFIYYGQTRHRIEIQITPELREKVCRDFEEMHQYYERRYTPKVRITKGCNACSIKDLCVPKLNRDLSVSDYIDLTIGGEEIEETS